MKKIKRTGVEGEWQPSPRDDHYRAKLKSLLKVCDNGCWEYQGWRNQWGYGQMGYCNDTWMVPRLAYVLWKGPIPGRQYICHTCDNPPCANPDHLFAAPSRLNLKDCVAKGRHSQANQTHCKHGHELSGDNVRFSDWGGKTRRQCKACQRAKCRIQQGWPRDLAFSVPVMPMGHQYDFATGTHSMKAPKNRRQVRTGGEHG